VRRELDAGAETKVHIGPDKYRSFPSPDGRHIAFTAGTWKHERWVMENFLPEEKVAAK